MSLPYCQISVLIFSFSPTQYPSDYSRAKEVRGAPTDISQAPAIHLADQDDRVAQSTILQELVGTTLIDPSKRDPFPGMDVFPLKLSKLETLYLNKDRSAVSLLSKRHEIHIDDRFRLRPGNGEIYMDTSVSMIDYHLTVANCMGLSAILPNAMSSQSFSFDLDLKKPYKGFKYKHAMLGFDPARRMLFIGRVFDDDVYLAMVPREFLQGHFVPAPAGTSSGSPLMSTRHYRQVAMMLAFFLCKVTHLSFTIFTDVYDQDLSSGEPHFEYITDALCVFYQSSFIISLHSPFAPFPLALTSRPGSTLSTCACSMPRWSVDMHAGSKAHQNTGRKMDSWKRTCRSW
jgi:hypothetical protein